MASPVTAEEIVLIMVSGSKSHVEVRPSLNTKSLPYQTSFVLNRSVKSLSSRIKPRTWKHYTACGFPAWSKYSVHSVVWKSVWQCVKEWGRKGVTMTSLRLSWSPNRLPAAAFKVALCVLRAIITKPLRLGQWSPVGLYCMPGLAWQKKNSSRTFVIYTHTLPTWSPQAKTSCMTAPLVRSEQNCGDYCHSLPSEHSSALCFKVWSDLCQLTADRKVPQQSQRTWAHEQLPSFLDLTSMQVVVSCVNVNWNYELRIFLSTIGTPRNSWITSECHWKLKLAAWGCVPR